ncbi:DUF7713 domain-containing protein [Caballeronia sordidicola]|uniref:DUF7713 domain-containing protein n=2 Tax=Caballeronia TaxID=1827195 RepID=UPI0004D03D06|nr:hypothetical protein [Caballeronia sordidicola]
MSVSQCAACGTNVPPYETVNTTNEGLSGRLLCTACFNREMAHHAGIDNFGSIKFEPVHLNDANGVAHEFHFRTLLFGDKLSLESFESTSDDEPSGYRFQIIGDPLADQFVLLGMLIEKMRRSLAVIHIRDTDLGLQIIDDTVRGRIEWDGSDDSRMPCVVIDGRRVEWDELGHMLMTFEGWQFKLEVHDPSDEM